MQSGEANGVELTPTAATGSAWSQVIAALPQPLATLPAADLQSAALACLTAAEADAKLALTATVATAWQQQRLPLRQAPGRAVIDPLQPGRPARLALVAPRQLAQRQLTTPEGRAVLFHALAHIEFNAINLAWDAIYRFDQLPDAYYHDWVRVAAEEAYHFVLLRDHLRQLGSDYGDWPAHDGLWQMALQTAADPLARMALVPRMLEARGLDVTPGMQQRLRSVGDHAGAALLDTILADEIGHVAIGDRWFRYLCAQRGVQPEATWQALLSVHLPRRRPSGPLHRTARLAAGFSEAELAWLAESG